MCAAPWGVIRTNQLRSVTPLPYSLHFHKNVYLMLVCADQRLEELSLFFAHQTNIRHVFSRQPLNGGYSQGVLFT